MMGSTHGSGQHKRCQMSSWITPAHTHTYLGRDAVVRCHGQLQTTAERVSVNGRHHGQLTFGHPVEHHMPAQRKLSRLSAVEENKGRHGYI